MRGGGRIPFVPPTEPVNNLRQVEDTLIFAHVKGRRNWEELFRTVFKEAFPKRRRHMHRMVQASLRRLADGHLPVCVMDEFWDVQAFNARCLLK